MSSVHSGHRATLVGKMDADNLKVQRCHKTRHTRPTSILDKRMSQMQPKTLVRLEHENSLDLRLWKWRRQRRHVKNR